MTTIRRPRPRRPRALASILVGALLAVALPLVAAPTRPALGQTTEPAWTLPRPSGPSPIGSFRGALHTPRVLPVQFWYPTDPGRTEPTSAYVPDPVLLDAMKRDEYLNIPSDVLDGWLEVATSAHLGAPLASAPRLLPVLVFSHGFGMSPVNYTALIQDLASHGYFVVAIDHPLSGLTVMPDGSVVALDPHPDGPPGKVEQLRADAGAVVSALFAGQLGPPDLAGRLDPDRIAMLGHSLGGAASLDACRVDPRFRVCVDLDGDAFGKVEQEGVARPYMVLLNQPAEEHRPPVEMRQERDAGWARIAALQPTPGLVVKIANTMHLSFSDLPFLVPRALMLRNGATIEPQRGHDIIAELIRVFLATHLGDATASIATVAARYPEVTVSWFHRP